MRKVAFLLALTLTIPTPNSIYRFAFASTDEPARPAARRVVETSDKESTSDLETLFKPEALLIKDQSFQSAYRDGFTILSTDNNCSRFFGGTADVLLEVFSQMTANFRKGYLDSEIGIQMSGDYSCYNNVLSGLSYRLFEKETVNLQGAFYKEKKFNSALPIPKIGHFAPNTREARVLMLLHEMAHLIKGPDGQWLIPNDGSDNNQSLQNTELIEKHCGEDIRKLG